MKRRILALLLCLLMTAIPVSAGDMPGLVLPRPTVSQNTKNPAENKEETGMAEDGSYRLPDAVVYVPYYIDLAEELRGESLYFESVDKLPSWLTLEDGVLSGMPVFEEEKEEKTEEEHRFKIRVYGELPDSDEDSKTGSSFTIPDIPSKPAAPDVEPEKAPETEPEKNSVSEPDSDEYTFVGYIIARTDAGGFIAVDPNTGRMIVVNSHARAALVDTDSISIDPSTGKIILTDPHTGRTLAIDLETGTVRTVDGGEEEAPESWEPYRSGPAPDDGIIMTLVVPPDKLSGSPMITISDQTLENAGKGSHTIPATFQAQDDSNTVRHTSENYQIDSLNAEDQAGTPDANRADSLGGGNTAITPTDQSLGDTGKGSQTIPATFQDQDGSNTVQPPSQDNLIGSLQSTVNYFGDYTVVEFVLRVKKNTDENVAKTNVKGYEVIQPIPDMLEVEGPFDFISAGPFAEFEAVFLNGRRLRRDVDYTANEGTTAITLAEQTLRDTGKGSHTISATFRSRNGTNTLRTSSQNFLIGSLQSTVDYYSVSVVKSENGNLRANLSHAAKGTVVGLYAEPGKKSRLENVTVKDADGREVTVTKKSDTEFSFVMPGSAVTASAVFTRELSDLGFDDVFPEDWFYETVKWAVGEDITNGITQNSFEPYVDCSQAHILTFLWRAAGCPETIIENPYPDLPDMYYVKPAIWAYEKGMVSEFDPQRPCTRSEVVMYQWILAGRPNVSAAKFTDVPDSAPYAQAVAWAIQEGITKGVGNHSFAPDKSCNRAEIVTFLHRDNV